MRVLRKKSNMQITEEKDDIEEGWIKCYNIQEGTAETEQWRKRE